jgi:hypothetical protein
MIKPPRRGLSYRKLCAYPQTSFSPLELSHFACLYEQLGLGTTRVSEYLDPCLMYIVTHHKGSHDEIVTYMQSTVEKRMSFVQSDRHGKKKSHT